MKNRKVLIRRTFLQERFDILIKKQRDGHATFADLTELDWIVNRDPALRDRILENMQGIETPPNDSDFTEPSILQPQKQVSLLEQLKAFLSRLFFSNTPVLKPTL